MNTEKEKFENLDAFFLDLLFNLRKDFYKTVFYLATGIIVFSVSVIQLDPNRQSLYSSDLFYCWLFMGLSILMVLFFYIISEKKYNYLYRQLDFKRDKEAYQFYEVFVKDKIEKDLIDSNHGKIASFFIRNGSKLVNYLYKSLNYITAIAFFTGVFFFIKFAYKNFLS